MPRVKRCHYRADLTGFAHVNSGSSIADSTTDLPPAGVLSASGERPTSAIYVNYDGNIEPGTTAERCEVPSGYRPAERSVFWVDTLVKLDAAFATITGDNWNFISQTRDDGTPDKPSPSPAIGVRNNELIMRRALYDPVNGNFGTTPVIRSFGTNSADRGGGWHRITYGCLWTEQNDGWMEGWFDGVFVFLASGIRTARESSQGATDRVGVYRDKDNPNLNGPARIRFFAREVWNERPPTITGGVPGGGGGGTPTPDTSLPPFPVPASRRLGMQSTGSNWLALGADSVRGSVFQTTVPKTSSGGYIPARGRQTGAGSQPVKLLLYRVIDEATSPASDVLEVAGSQASVPFDSDALFYPSTWATRTLPAGLWRPVIASGPNEVAEYLRDDAGGLAWGRDTFSDGAANTFGGQVPTSIATDTPRVNAFVVIDDVVISSTNIRAVIEAPSSLIVRAQLQPGSVVPPGSYRWIMRPMSEAGREALLTLEREGAHGYYDADPYEVLPGGVLGQKLLYNRATGVVTRPLNPSPEG